MPELPEVEHGRRVAERITAGRVIARVICADDPIVFGGLPAPRMSRALTGRRVVAARRWGKQLWLELDEGPHPLFHFGMTGAFRTQCDAPLALASGPTASAEWPPPFWKIRLMMDDGGELVMTNARRLGRITLRDDPEREPPVRDLGFDPLLALPRLDDLAARLAARGTRIKSLLLDQRFAAGVGNWIADEVLYRARIAPQRRARELSRDEVRRLRAALRHVVTTAVGVDARSERFPADWLFHRRWGRKSNTTTADGERIEHIEIGGRTTAWVPSVQR